MINNRDIQLFRNEYESLMDGDIIKNDVNHFINIIESMKIRKIKKLPVLFNLYNYKLVVNYNQLDSNHYIIQIECGYNDQYVIFELKDDRQLYINTYTIDNKYITDIAEYYEYLLLLRIISLHCLTLKKEVAIVEFENYIKAEYNFYYSKGCDITPNYITDKFRYIMNECKSKIILTFHSNSEIKVNIKKSVDNLLHIEIISNSTMHKIDISIDNTTIKYIDNQFIDNIPIYKNLIECIYIFLYFQSRYKEYNIYQDNKLIVNKMFNKISQCKIYKMDCNLDIIEQFEKLLTIKRLNVLSVNGIRIMCSQGVNNIAFTIKDGYNTIHIGVSLMWKSEYCQELVYTICIDKYTLTSRILDYYNKDLHSHTIINIIRLLLEDGKNDK